MNKKIIYLLFFLIVILSSLLRLWKLGEVPISPDWDEVSLGYNAYSIFKTGRDEYGQFLPIILRSFDDYKPALYAYLTIPSISLFGLNIFAVRLPSAIFGILTVITTYFLVKEIFNLSEERIKQNYIPEIVALLSAFLLAVSPWHIQFSRIAFEANVGLALSVISTLFFLKGLRQPLFLVIASVLTSINLYSYQSEKILMPFLLTIFITLFWQKLMRVKKKYLLLAALLWLLIAFPLITFTVTNSNVFARAKGVSIFSNNTLLLKDDLDKISKDRANNDYLGLILDNRRTTYAKTAVGNYLSHFDLNWLFIKGDFENNRHHAPNMGLLYLFDLPFLLIGIYVFLFGFLGNQIDKKLKVFILSLVFITPIPSAITKDVPHAVRTLHFLPLLQIFIAFGLVTTFVFINRRLKKVYLKLLTIIFIIFLFIFNFSYYLNQYFVQLNYFYAKDWQYGYKELIDFLKPIHRQYKKVIVSNRRPLDQSYMFFLFYLQYDPKKYQVEGGTRSGSIGEEGNKFLNFEFRQFDYYKEKEGNLLFVGSPSDFPEVFITIKEINYPDGKLAMRVVKKD